MRKFITLLTGILTLALACHALTLHAAAGGKGEQADLRLKKNLEKAPILPVGVNYVALPPGEVRMMHILRNGSPVIRISVGKTTVTAREIFLGDANGATHFRSEKDGVHWLPASNTKGFVFGLGGYSVREPGSVVSDPDYYPLKKLTSGCVFVTSPSLKFAWGHQAKTRPTGREGAPTDKPNIEVGFPLPDGVIHVALPKIPLEITAVQRGGETLQRTTTRESVVEAAKFLIGDDKGAARYRLDLNGAIDIFDNGGTLAYQEFTQHWNMERGSVFLTTPMIMFLWGDDAKPPKQ